MAQHNCENCLIRAKYDQAPKSLIGRFWRWHINFCPGWKGYRHRNDEANDSFNERQKRFELINIEI